MGKWYSKEDKEAKEEVIIAQNGNSSMETHMSQQSLMMIAIMSLLGIVMLYFLWKKFRSSIETWLRSQVATGTGSAPTPTQVRAGQSANAPLAI